MAEQHVHWRVLGRNASNFEQAGFERAARDNEQLARDEVDVAIARATQMSCVELLARMDFSSSDSIGRDEWRRKRRTGNPEKKFSQ